MRPDCDLLRDERDGRPLSEIERDRLRALTPLEQHQHVGYAADGHQITAVGGVVYDDEYIAAEQAHFDEQRAQVICKYGSEEAYERHELARTRWLRRERRATGARIRIERLRHLHPRGCTTSTRPLARRRGAGRPRRSSSSSVTSGADPGEPPAASSALGVLVEREGAS